MNPTPLPALNELPIGTPVVPAVINCQSKSTQSSCTSIMIENSTNSLLFPGIIGEPGQRVYLAIVRRP